MRLEKKEEKKRNRADGEQIFLFDNKMDQNHQDD